MSESQTAAATWQNRLLNVLRAGESFAMRAPLRFALLATLALLVLSVTALEIRYDTNDDVFMSMIVAGQGFCDSPDEHIPFSNVLIGIVLKQLYSAWPLVPWYGGYLLLAHYLALAGILYCALVIEPTPTADRAKNNLSEAAARQSFRRRFAIFLVFFAVVELVSLNSLQFTSTAFLAAQAGILLLCLAAQRRIVNINASVLGPLSAAVCLIILAGLIRLESLGLAFAVASPLAVLFAFTSSRKALVPIAAAVGFAALVVFAAANLNRGYYDSSPDWNRFYAFNQLRCKFNDYEWISYTSETASIFDAVGWTRNDHGMIARWFFDDPSLYSEGQLRTVLDAYPWKTARLTPSYFVELFRRPLQDRSLWAATLAMPFMLVGAAGTRFAKRVVLASIVVGLLLIVAIGITIKVPPPRLYFALLTFPLSATLLFPAPIAALPVRKKTAGGVRHMFHNWLSQPRWTRTIAVLLIVGTVMGVHRQFRRSAKAERDRAALKTFLADARSNSHKLYVCWEAAIPYELISPLDNLTSLQDLSIVNLSWMQRTCWSESVKQRFGITNLAKALYERDDIVLVANDTHRALFTTYAKEHFGADVEFIPSLRAGKNLVAGSFQQRLPRDETATKPAAADRR